MTRLTVSARKPSHALRLLGATGFVLVSLVGCGKSSPKNNNNGDTVGQGDGTQGDSDTCETCKVSSTCTNRGEICTGECCVPWAGCSPGGCAGGEFCDPVTLACKTVAARCDEVACECSIIDSTGTLSAKASSAVSADNPLISIAAGATQDIQVVIAEIGGNPLPGGAVTLSVSSGDGFTAGGSSITGADTAGTGVLEAKVDGVLNAVTCYANIVNVGAAPTNQVQVFVFDDSTGLAIAGATVIMDSTGDGLDDGSTSASSTSGLSTTTAFVGGETYTVTAFASGYQYVSMVGLTENKIAIPLSARAQAPEANGFTGKLSFDEYETRFTDGKAKLLKFAVVSASLPLKSLLNLNLSGGSGATSTDCTNPDAVCYDINIPAFSVNTTAALPGGLVFGVASSPVKETFDVTGTPGRRYAWSFGGEIGFSDLAPLMSVAAPALSNDACACNVTADVCDDNCSQCDTDCIQIGQVFDAILPLFANFASGVRGNVQLSPVPEAQWLEYIKVAYADRDPTEKRFPRLDGDATMQLLELMRVHSNFKVPDLPPDPVQPGQKMEGMVLLTGINTVGAGFVPLGFSLALDCTEGDCTDRSSGKFDGKVNGARQCQTKDNDPAIEKCDSGVTAVLDDGRIGLYHAPAHAGMQSGQWMTLSLALPISSILSEQNGASVTGYVFRGEPQAGSSEQLNCPSCYPDAPVLKTAENRRYTPDTTGGHDLHWVTFARNGAGNAPSTRWNVFFSKTGGEFVAPAVPATYTDPLAPAQTKVNVTHIGFKLATSTLSSFAAHNGSTIGDITKELDGFALTSGDVCAESCQ